jgi:UDP-3-O-acyl-N-acetylglucosamine deacetylase
VPNILSDHLCQKCGAYVMCDNDVEVEIERLRARVEQLERCTALAAEFEVRHVAEIERLSAALEAVQPDETEKRDA